MHKYIVYRLINLIPVMFGISLITFGLISITPGDPAEIIIRQRELEPTSETIEVMREELGLNYPLPIQYIRWVWNILHLDLGRSFYTGEPVLQELLERFPATLQLTIAGMIVMLVISIPMGILTAVYKHSVIDHLGRIGALMGASLPSFWLGLLLIYYFSVKWSLLPAIAGKTTSYIILPAITLGAGMAVTYARLLRGSMLEVLAEDFIRVARAKGLAERTVIMKHALKNGLLPVVTALGMSFGYLLGGTVIVETIFAWPGMGRFVVDSIASRDYPIIQGFVLFMAFIFVLVNLLVDISYHFLDPRIKLD